VTQGDCDVHEVTFPLDTCCHLQNPGLTTPLITISPSGSLIPGESFTLTATAQSSMYGGTLTVAANLAGITCQPSRQTGVVTSLQTLCTVTSTTTTGQYSLDVTWVTNAQQSSTAIKTVQVVSAALNRTMHCSRYV
jgi:hypothetical protein